MKRKEQTQRSKAKDQKKGLKIIYFLFSKYYIAPKYKTCRLPLKPRNSLLSFFLSPLSRVKQRCLLRNCFCFVQCVCFFSRFSVPPPPLFFPRPVICIWVRGSAMHTTTSSIWIALLGCVFFLDFFYCFPPLLLFNNCLKHGNGSQRRIRIGFFLCCCFRGVNACSCSASCQCEFGDPCWAKIQRPCW